MSKVKQVTPSAEIDETVTVDGWQVDRRGAEVIFTSRGKRPKESLSKTYGSLHAAKVALGRVRHDASMAGDIVGRIKIDQIKGYQSSPKRQQAALVKSDFALFVALELLEEEKGKDCTDKVLKVVASRIKSGERFQGIQRLRERLSKASADLKVEMEKDAH
jgi:dephospho-CoA kinase